MNALDKLIAFFDPEAGLQRQIARSQMMAVGSYTGYDGATYNRERSDYSIYRSLPGYEENVLNPYDRNRMVATLRDLYRNNEMCRAVVDRMPDYIVHTGIRPQAQTRDRAWNDQAEEWFERWTQVADYQHRPGVTFHRMQRQCVIDRMLYGESLYIPMATGHLYPLSTDRLTDPQSQKGKPNLHQGIKTSADGVVLGYWVCGMKPNGQVDATKANFYPRENFIHTIWPWRVASQWRGVPELAPIMNKLQDMQSTDKYQLLKMKNEAMQFLKHTKGKGHGFANSRPRGFQRTDDDAGGEQVIQKNEWGRIWKLAADDDVAAIEGKTPNSQYVPYLEFQARTLGAALGIPYEFVLMMFTKGSYSAQRTALLHFLHKIIQWHSELTTQFCQRVWNWRVAKAMKNGELPLAPKDDNGVSEWYKVTWSLPEMGWVDPEKAVDAQATEWSFGTKSLKQIASSQGKDRNQVLAEKATDIQEAQRVADALNAENPGINVTWRDIIDPHARSGQNVPAGGGGKNVDESE